jgi:hypothetical protein
LTLLKDFFAGGTKNLICPDHSPKISNNGVDIFLTEPARKNIIRKTFFAVSRLRQINHEKL